MLNKINLGLCLGIMLFLVQSVYASSDEDGEKVKVHPTAPITTHTGGSRAPARKPDIPDLYFFSSPPRLEVIQSNNENNIPFSIINSSGTTIMYGTIVFNEDGLSNIDVSELTIGYYIIEFICNGYSYSGMFQM